MQMVIPIGEGIAPKLRILILTLGRNRICLKRHALVLLLHCICTNLVYGKGFALLIGANKIAHGAYKSSYSEAAVSGVPMDISRMKEVLELAEFKDVRILVAEKATRGNIQKELQNLKKELKPNDVFVFYFTGHGDTLTDANNDELPYLFDQAFVTYNGYLIDDELNAFWKSLPRGIKIYQVVDACFSGEMHKVFRPSELSPQFHNRLIQESSRRSVFTCAAIDGTQNFTMYSIAAATKERTTIPHANGEGVLTNDIYSLYKKFRRNKKIKNMTAEDFFRSVCSATSGFMFLKIYPDKDVFSSDYVFQLNH